VAWAPAKLAPKPAFCLTIFRPCLSIGPAALGLPPPLRPEQAILGLAVLPVSFTYAILRYQVLDVHLLQRWLVHALIWGGIVTSYVLALLGLTWVLPLSGLSRGGLVLLGAMLAAAVSLTFPRLRHPLEGWADRRLFGDIYDYQASLQQVSQSSSLGVDLGALGRSLPATLAELMNLRFATLLLRDPGGLRALGGVGDQPPDLLPAAASALAADERQARLLPLRPPAGPALLAPLQTPGATVGCLCLGPKQNGEPFRHEDQTLLLTLGGHVAAIVRNAQLADDLRSRAALLDQFNARLEHAQEEERARLAAEVHDEPLQLALHLRRQIAAEDHGRDATERQVALSEMIVDRLRAVCLAVRPAASSR
jgi:signal transduction histidine kinase